MDHFHVRSSFFVCMETLAKDRNKKAGWILNAHATSKLLLRSHMVSLVVGYVSRLSLRGRSILFCLVRVKDVQHTSESDFVFSFSVLLFSRNILKGRSY